MKLLRAIAITCFASFFAIIAYGQGEVVDLDKMESSAESCGPQSAITCKDVLIDLMDQVAAAQDRDLMEPMECPEVEQQEPIDAAYCNEHINAQGDEARFKRVCQLVENVVESMPPDWVWLKEVQEYCE